MNPDGNQRKMYALALAVLLVAIGAVSAWLIWRPEPSRDTVATVTPTESASMTALPSIVLQPTPIATDIGAVAMFTTVVYYQDNYGYLVPVARTIRAETGVAKATLNLMVQSVYNDMEAARLGLRTVIPEKTTFDLDIADGVARIDLSAEALNCADAQAERNMVDAIVQTLTCFDTVDCVRFLVNGQNRETLRNGTSVKGDFLRKTLNPETDDVGDSAVMLYFTGDSPSMIVPVTRAVYGKADVATAVLELVKGPSTESPLEGVIPSGCGLIGVEVKNGVAKVNFTRDFIRIAENSDGGRMAMKALSLTCSQFDGVKKVEILVEGQAYDPGMGTLAMPTFVNSAGDIYDAFIQERSRELFDFE